MKAQILKLIDEYLYRNSCSDVYKSIYHSKIDSVQNSPQDLKSFMHKGFSVCKISYNELRLSLHVSHKSLFDSLAILNQIGIIKSVAYRSEYKNKIFYSIGENSKLYVDYIVEDIINMGKDNEINYSLIQYYFNKKRGISYALPL